MDVTINSMYLAKCAVKSDIWRHLPSLMELSKECTFIAEMGVRGLTSTWAFLEGLSFKGGKLYSFDIDHPSKYNDDLEVAEALAAKVNIDFKFIQGNTRKIEIPENVDMLFIDTLHTYKQLSIELKLHHKKANKYIVLHDTDTFRFRDEVSSDTTIVGLWPAVEELLSYSDFKIEKEYTNNNGLLILKR